MTPFYDLTQFSPMSLLEGDDHDQSHLHPFTTLPNDHNTSPLSCPIFFNTPQVQIPNNTDLHLIQDQTLNQQHQQEFIDRFLIQEPINFPASSSFLTNTNDVTQRSLCDQQHARDQDQEDQQKSGKWMSSKMRIMRKMMNPDGIITKKRRRIQQLLQDQQNKKPSQASSNSDGIVRVCSDCSTTKTPLWRTGPSGPKSLCNACGIRQRKARWALAAAAAVSGGLIPAAAAPNKGPKEKESDVERTVPFKKRCRFSKALGANNQKKKLCFDDIVISLSKSSAFHRVFPQDEKDAAILLMALSCGLMSS